MTGVGTDEDPCKGKDGGSAGEGDAEMFGRGPEPKKASWSGVGIEKLLLVAGENEESGVKGPRGGAFPGTSGGKRGEKLGLFRGAEFNKDWWFSSVDGAG